MSARQLSVAEVEQAIGDEEQALAHVAELLLTKRAWLGWPAPLRRALALAVDEQRTGSEISAWQARVLLHHLFGPDVWRSPLPQPVRTSPGDLRRAERLRADLPRLVKLRAGEHLAVSAGR